MKRIRLAFLIPILILLLAACVAATSATPEPVDTDAIVGQVLEELRPQLQSGQQPLPVSLPSTAAVASSDLEQTLVDLYARANPAVVYIITPAGSGSGFVYDQRGHIVTNNHVTRGGGPYEIVFAGGERLEAELIGADVDSDLAVLKVDRVPQGVEPLPLADPDSLRVGQFVVAIGNPFGEQGSMTLGIISGLGRSLRSQRGGGLSSSYSLPQVIQTDAPINPGNSGGPLLNLQGEVVGVNSAIATTTGTNSGVGFSIPVAAVRRIVPVLIREGHYVYPYMGAAFAEEISLSEQKLFALPQTQGAYVLSITPGGPADRAGVIAADPNTGRGGDLIIAIDGQPIRNFSDLNTYLVFHTEVGQTIELTVLRDGRTITLPLTLGERP
ncbi:MAG: PDZ domain-containing protein [Caldilineae bacterium]|nr:MAG: PDZ domain-containing protein [Caldilineae bacterium]